MLSASSRLRSSSGVYRIETVRVELQWGCCRKRQGRVGRPTHTLDHHGASPIWGLGPSHVLNIMNHHGADTVCIAITAARKSKWTFRVLPATQRHREPVTARGLGFQPPQKPSLTPVLSEWPSGQAGKETGWDLSQQWRRWELALHLLPQPGTIPPPPSLRLSSPCPDERPCPRTPHTGPQECLCSPLTAPHRLPPPHRHCSPPPHWKRSSPWLSWEA